MFIVFEGLESSGKSTQIKSLCDNLKRQQVDVEVVAEPGTTQLGQAVRQLVLHKDIPICPLAELLLYEAARAQLTAQRIQPALQRGKVVIADRYTLSSLAYQGYGRSLDLDKLRALDAWATGGLAPNLTLYFDILPEEMRKRQGAHHRPDRLEKEDAVFFERVRQGYLKELKRVEGAHCFDGSLSAEVLQQAILRLVIPLLDDA